MWSDLKDSISRKVAYFLRRICQYKRAAKGNVQARKYFEENYDRIRSIFEDDRVWDLIFGPIKGLTRSAHPSTEEQVQGTISKVALANAVVAGLPGKLGVGVYVSMALELWMALRIGNFVGIKLDSKSDIFKYTGLFGGVLATVLWLFVHLLRAVFSIINIVAFLPATVISELIVTNFVGVLFWVAFEEAADQRSFRVPFRLIGRAVNRTTRLTKFQTRIVKTSLHPAKLREVGERLAAWLKGDLVLPDPQKLRADAFVVGAMAAVFQNDETKLNGPLGEIFLESIRNRWSSQLSREANIEEIASLMRGYDDAQIAGVLNTIKGKMFEHMVAIDENHDGDTWMAELHTDESFPGSDIIFTNIENGDTVEVSLKAVEDAGHIETALMRYPDIPVLTTSEMSDNFADNDMVATTDIAHEKLSQDVQGLFDDVAKVGSISAERVLVVEGVTAGTAAASLIHLWPYTIAYLRGKICKEELEENFISVLGEQGKELASRIALAAVLGPIYVWYLLAKSVMGMGPDDLSESQKQITRISFINQKDQIQFP